MGALAPRTMSETPLQFRYQGRAAELRADAVAAAVPRPTAIPSSQGRRRTWVWLGVPCLSLVGVMLGKTGVESPVYNLETVEISPPSVPLPAQTVLEVAVSHTEPAPAPNVESVREPPTASQVPVRKRRARADTAPAPPAAVVARVTLGRIDTPDREGAANLRRAVVAALESVRSCCEALMQTRTDLKGTVFADVSVRDGHIAFVNVESAIRDTHLRLCFRKGLMTLAVEGASSPIDARLHFLLVPQPELVRPQ